MLHLDLTMIMITITMIIMIILIMMIMIETLTTKDCKGLQTNMPKNVGSIKTSVISKNKNVDILNSASRILQC